MSSDIFVFTPLTTPARTPAGDVWRPAPGITIEEGPWESIVFEPGLRRYVEEVMGPSRVETLTYRGPATLAIVADVLEAHYADQPSLTNPDCDGIFPVPELITLLRTAIDGAFHPYADPADRR